MEVRIVCEGCGGEVVVEAQAAGDGVLRVPRVATCPSCEEDTSYVGDRQTNAVYMAWVRDDGMVLDAQGRCPKEQARALQCCRHWEIEGTPVVVAERYDGDLLAFGPTSNGLVRVVRLSPDYWLYVDHYKT